MSKIVYSVDIDQSDVIQLVDSERRLSELPYYLDIIANQGGSVVVQQDFIDPLAIATDGYICVNNFSLSAAVNGYLLFHTSTTIPGDGEDEPIIPARRITALQYFDIDNQPVDAPTISKRIIQIAALDIESDQTPIQVTTKRQTIISTMLIDGEQEIQSQTTQSRSTQVSSVDI